MNATHTSLIAWVLLAIAFAAPRAGGQAAETLTLHDAALQNNVEALQRHIDNGADLDKPDELRRTALGRAAEAGRVDALTLLITSGANVDTPSAGTPPLVLATLQRHLNVATILLSHNADANAKDTSGRTALIIAAENGQTELAQLLIAKGADVNSRDNRGTTPLSAASRNRQRDVVQILKENGAQEPVNAYGRDPYGQSGVPQAGNVPTGPMTSSAATQPNLLSDPNAIRAKIASHAGLQATLTAIDANATSIERSWASRRSDNRATLVRAVSKQFAAEMMLVAKLATDEKAPETLVSTAQLLVKRQARYQLIASDLREARRLAQQEARASTTRGRGRGGTRGTRAGAGAATGPDAYDLSSQAADPYRSRPPRTARPSGTAEEVPEQVADPDAQGQADAWLAASPEDKRSLLTTVHDLDLLEYGALRQVAVGEEANKTAAAIEGLMLARQDRVARISAKMADDDQRLQRMTERYGTTPGGPRSRRGRGTTQPGAASPRRGRRAP